MGDPTSTHVPLPMDFVDQQPIIKPSHILAKRAVLLQGHHKPQVLVQWEGQPETDATWESINDLRRDFPDFNLEDKVEIDGGSIVAVDGHGSQQRGRRIRHSTKTRKFADFVTT